GQTDAHGSRMAGRVHTSPATRRNGLPPSIGWHNPFFRRFRYTNLLARIAVTPYDIPAIGGVTPENIRGAVPVVVAYRGNSPIRVRHARNCALSVHIRREPTGVTPGRGVAP